MSCFDTGVSFVRLTVLTLVAVEIDWLRLRLGALAELSVLMACFYCWLIAPVSLVALTVSLMLLTTVFLSAHSGDCRLVTLALSSTCSSVIISCEIVLLVLFWLTLSKV